MALERIVRMCEIESQIAFCKGVRQSINSAIKNLDKIENKIKMEFQRRVKKCAWEIPISDNRTYEEIMIDSGF